MATKMTREEAIRRIKAWNLDSDDMEVLAVVIPELAESEDERIRKRLIEYFEGFRMGNAEVKWEGLNVQEVLVWLEKQKEQKPIIQDVELNDAVYDYVRDHFIAGADFTPEYIKKLMENAFFAGVDYYLLKQKSESCESDTNVEKVIEDVIRVYGKTQGEWVGGYDVDTLIVNLRRAFNKKEHKPAEWNDTDMKEARNNLISVCRDWERGMQTALLPIAAVRARYFLEHLTEPKPVEWSEEDENVYKTIMDDFNGITPMSKAYKLKAAGWLKSLRLQYHGDVTMTEAYKMGKEAGEASRWKPSEEQMDALHRCVDYLHGEGSGYFDPINSLYEQLKKL